MERTGENNADLIKFDNYTNGQVNNADRKVTNVIESNGHQRE